MPFKDVLYNLSYTNLMLYGAVIPSFDSEDNEKNNGVNSDSNDDILWVDDPKNREKAIEMINKMI